MKKKNFTIIEMMIALVISSTVFIALMGMVMNVTWLVRDNIAAQALSNHARYVRYALLNGSGNKGGLSSATGKITKDSETSALTYKTSKNGEYDLKKAIGDSNYTPTTDDVEILATAEIKFDGEKQLPNSIKLLQDSKLTVSDGSDVSDGNNVYVRSYLRKKILGKIYEMGILIRTSNNK